MATQQEIQASARERTLVIDADAHVVESEHTWDYMDPSEADLRPVLTSLPDNPNQKFWLIGGKRRGFRFPAITPEALRERRERTGRRFDLPAGTSDVHDVELRLDVMDDTGIDVQICHNTLWINEVADEPALERALCRSWNRWMAEAWQSGKGRLRWTCVVPTLDLEEAARQAKFAKDNGAVGVCMRPVEGNRVIIDPYFYPIFEVAQELDLPMAIHIANSNNAHVALWSGGAGGFNAFRVPTVMACAALLTSPVAQRFPRLRWGFIEASAGWLPWVTREAKTRLEATNRPIAENMVTAANVYVTCQNDDDIPYLIDHGFLDNLVIGTDFGHFDASSDVDAISKFQANDLSPEAKEKILYHNPKALYSL